MQSRRDQVQAQSYLYSRLTSALISAEPEAAENPTRRTVIGTIAGLVVAGLAVVGFTVYGFIVPGGSTSWRQPGVLIVEAETGNRYVYVNDTLHPVLNYASALMLFEGTPQVVRVSARSMAGVAHGAPIGVPGAPDAIPDGSAMRDQVWTVCAVALRDAAGTVLTATTLHIGRPQPGHTQADGTEPSLEPLGDDEAVLVVGPDQRGYLVWQGHRHAIGAPWVARALGFEGYGMPVERGWLEALPAGPDLTPARLPGRGEPGVPVAGADTFVGQLFVTRTAGVERHYVMQRDGLSLLSPVGYAIVAGDPETAQAYGGGAVAPVELTSAEVAQAPLSRSSTFAAGLSAPIPRPAALSDGTTWCIKYTVETTELVVGAGVPAQASASVPYRPEVTLTDLTATAIEVEAGVGGLVRGGWPGAEAGATQVLVTDAGIKYPLISDAVAEMLGYEPSSAAVVPPPLLELLPTGPLLDPGRLGG
jgi:type VII secretion protein EccB